jgi:antitoxin (DNA-binding transcriptional repressor) of toxin-antitoxin stability system
LFDAKLPSYNSYMKEAQISEVKNQLSRYLALVRRGEVVRILDRDRPIAQIVPISRATEGQPVGPEALAEMERKGLIRRGTGRIDREILEADPPGQPAGVLDALLEERDVR